jgi:hypothetical protein
VDTHQLYRDASVCGAPDLHALADSLADSLPPGGEVVALRLRDGREGELLWPLLAQRPDLRATVLDGSCCSEESGRCAYQVIRHIRQGGALVAPIRIDDCLTEVVDPGEQALLAALAPHLNGEKRYGLLQVPGPGADVDACKAAGIPTASSR